MKHFLFFSKCRINDRETGLFIAVVEDGQCVHCLAGKPYGNLVVQASKEKLKLFDDSVQILKSSVDIGKAARRSGLTL